MGILCPNCEVENIQDAVYCQECGKELQDYAQDSMEPTVIVTRGKVTVANRAKVRTRSRIIARARIIATT